MKKSTITIVKSTAPLIKSRGEAITEAMYRILFATYPGAEALFRDAPPSQRTKLANAVYAYAANIDKLEKLSGGIESMALAHVRTRVRPEHYPWVKDALVQAFCEVLGDDMTDEVLEAWSEAYDFLASTLIRREEELYAEV